MKKRAGKIKEVSNTAKSKGFSEDDLSKIRFFFAALLVLSVGFHFLKDFSDISVGKAYSVVFKGQEFAENVEVELLADVPEIIELTVDNAVKNILFGLTGSAFRVTVSVGDSVVFASDSTETQILDTFYATSEINNFCVAFPCRVPITITSETDGTLTLSSLEVEIESIEEVSLEEPAGEVEVAAVEGEATNILEFPAPNNFHCFLEENQNNPECSQYYKEECTSAQCWKVLACPRFYNPVCGVDALFYPSACWAEQLGTFVASYGYCDSLKKFISDLWSKEGFDVPSPNIEFAYSGTGHVSWKNGAFLRSVLWKDSSEFFILDYNINTEDGTQQSTFFSKHITQNPVYGTNLKSLLVFVMFDNAYPENVLLEWTNVYEPLINDYIKKKQILSNPIQYDLVPVVIDPPLGVERPSQSHLFFTQEEMQKVYDAANNKIGGSDYDIFIMSPVFLNGFGGYFSWWNDMEFIDAPLHPSEPYSDTDKQKGIDALAAFQDMFLTISHEILHALGLPGDHMPMGYGTAYLDAIGQNVDPITGKERTAPSWCDFFGTSQDYYVVEIPNNLEINVGQEPSWLSKSESLTGPCLSGLYNNEWLKDYDNDGKYEIMYKNNLIGKELQRALGWVDIDGDGITELIDPDAYGGWKEILEEPEPTPIACETTFDCPIYNKCEGGVCVNFCGGKTLDASSTAESGKEASQSAVQELNKLGYDVIGNADLSGFEIKKSGNKLIFSSETQFDVFDQQFDSFVFVDKNGNTANVQKRQNSAQKAKPKATHIVELLEKPLLEEKSELEKKLEMQKATPQTIKEKIQKQLSSHEQRLKNAKAKALEEMLEVNADIESKIIDEYKSVFNGFSVDITEQEALELKEISSVKNVYRNEEVKALLEESVNQISADELWKLKGGNNDLITGKGVTIGIIDTGVDYTHDDLGGCFGKNCKVIDGYDFVNNDNDPMDDHGHGTHVAATAAGNGILKGVAPDAKIVAYKVLDSGGSGSWSGIVKSIERSVDPNQDGDFSDHLDIISLSLGGSGNPDDPVSKAIDNAVEEGVIAVIAAGNSGPYEQSIGSPGTARKAITVGAVDKCDFIAYFSSRGPVVWENGILLKPDLAAPGVEICAAQFDDWLNERTCKDDKHIAISGTSMATPHVSGATALLLQAHPDWTPEVVKSALMSTSLDLGLSPIEQGAGRINVLEAYGAEIATEPQSIAFEMSSQPEHAETITIRNIIDEDVTVQLEILELKDQNGNNQDFASLNVSELIITRGSFEDIGFIIAMDQTAEGFFTGKILAKTDAGNYVIPFIFEKLSKLTVKAVSKDKKLHPSFMVHDEALSNVKYIDFGDVAESLDGNSFIFKVPAGSYTAYAIGEFESELQYILMDTIEVPPSSEVEIALELDDARPFTVKAESLNGNPLKLYQWSKGFNTYNNEKVAGVSHHDPIIGNQTIYISNKPDNNLDTDILLYMHGVPAREADLNEK